MWNKLDEETIHSDSVELFKIGLFGNLDIELSRSGLSQRH